MSSEPSIDISQIKLHLGSPYRTAIDISNENLDQFHQWTGYNTHTDQSSSTKFQMRDFHIDLGMAVLGFGVLCNWEVKSRKIEFKGKTHLIYELRGNTPPQTVPMYRQNCSEEMATFLHGRITHTLDFLRLCSKYSGVPHVHIISIRNNYVISAVWRPYQNKIWMIPVDQVEGQSFISHLI
ncbi:hypothetical protein TUMEXPCC7403_10005 [Tumidithrix helvetica PCC 7403]|uniref:hypothetical protein n=1 Tax=Tumidithrix helvetica TaxID=3457545 RepID=UPI003C8B3F0B